MQRRSNSGGQNTPEMKILFNATPTEKRAALTENGKVVELVVERPDQFRIVGNIYRGKIISILPGIQAAFIDIGLERSAFLHASDVDPSVLLESDNALIERFTQDDNSPRRRIAKIPIEKVLEVGQEILVQIVKEPIGTKGAKTTTQISLAGRFLVLVPDADFIGVSKKSEDHRNRRRLKQIISQLKPPGIGFIVRTIGLEVSEAEFIAEIKSLLEKWKAVQTEALCGSAPKLVHREMGITTSVIRDMFSEEVSRVIVDNREDYNEIRAYIEALSPELKNRIEFYEEKMPLFDRFGIERDLERSLRRKVWLRCGGYILFDQTEALLSIDVNTGRNVGKTDLEKTIFITNGEAAEEIARQMRLRDLGGLVVIDFIDMVRMENRRAIEEKMRDLLERDPSATAHTGLSKFCLMEITRKRVRPELRELYTDVCMVCNGLGWVFSPASISARIDRWLSRAEASGQQFKHLNVKVHPAVAGYLLKDDHAVMNRLAVQHGVTLDVLENQELDHDEFEFFEKNSNKAIVLRSD